MGLLHFLRRLVDWFGDGAHWRGSDGIPHLLAGHLLLVAISLAIALAISLPVGLALGHTGRGGFLAINVTNIGRALPSLAILVVAVQALGIGRPPAVVAITALSIPPILTNTYTAIRQVDPADRDAARGMGMTGLQVLTRVELPQATPVVFAGIRTAAVQAVATATLAGLVAYDCLGTLIYLGLGSGSNVELCAGAVVVVALALLTEWGLGLLQRALTPAGLRLGEAGRRGARPRLDDPRLDDPGTDPDGGSKVDRLAQV